ncbi:unnamed protein product [Ectocarpus sp. 12 AP-2014]
MIMMCGLADSLWARRRKSTIRLAPCETPTRGREFTTAKEPTTC